MTIDFSINGIHSLSPERVAIFENFGLEVAALLSSFQLAVLLDLAEAEALRADERYAQPLLQVLEQIRFDHRIPVGFGAAGRPPEAPAHHSSLW